MARESVRLETTNGELLAAFTCPENVCRADIRRALSAGRVVAVRDDGTALAKDNRVAMYRQAVKELTRQRDDLTEKCAKLLVQCAELTFELTAARETIGQLSQVTPSDADAVDPDALGVPLADDEGVHEEGFDIAALEAGATIAIYEASHDEVLKAKVAKVTPKRVYLDIAGKKDPFVDREEVIGLVVKVQAD